MAARIIGIAGKAESGKDSAAGFITTVYPRHYYRRAFADALKRKALEQLAREGRLPFDANIPLADPAWVLATANQLKEADPEFRSLLQNVGRAERVADPDHWIARLFRDHMDMPRFGLLSLVIPDVRFRNEAEAIIERGGLVIRLERPGHENRLTPEQRAHISETDLDDFPTSGQYNIVVNTGDPVDLLRKVLAEVDRANGWRR